MPKARRRASTATIIKAMQILAVGEPIGDGVANAAILEAADRLEELDELLREVTGPYRHEPLTPALRRRISRALK